MALVKKFQCAFKQFVDVGLAYLMRREEIVQVKVRKSAVRHSRWKKFPQAARFNSAQRTNLFEYHALHGVVKNTWLQQPADFQARAGFEQHGAKKAQRVALELKSVV